MKNNQRLVDIDIAKGLAIFLVVLGHIVATTTPVGHEWYSTLKSAIYLFHMPFFMFISGLIMAHTYKEILNTTDYFSYVKKKAYRLLPAFLLFGLIIYFGKIISSQFVFVDNVPDNFLTELYYLFLIPELSSGGSLWFIYVLLEMYIIFPILIILFKTRPIFILLIGIVLYFTPITNILLLNRLFEYFIFFGLGVFIVWHYQQYLNLVDKFFYLWFALFSFALFGALNFDLGPEKLILGLLSIPAIHGLVRKPFIENISILKTFGHYTFSIYLMNTIFIGLAKGIILVFVFWGGYHFYWVAPVLLLAGLFGPILVKKILFSRIKPLDKMTS